MSKMNVYLHKVCTIKAYISLYRSISVQPYDYNNGWEIQHQSSHVAKQQQQQTSHVAKSDSIALQYLTEPYTSPNGDATEPWE